MRTLLCLTALAAAALGQSVATTPLSGFVYHGGTRSLHALLGVPGSAFAGPALATDLDRAWPAPSGALALAVRDGATVILTGLDGAEPVQWTDGRLIVSPDLAAWSPDGASAVLAGGGKLQLIRWSQGVAEPETPIETGFLGEFVTLAAEGTKVAVATGEAVYVFEGGAARRLSDIAGVRVLRFGTDGVLFAATAVRLMRIDSTGVVETLLESPSIAGFGVSRRTGRLYVADTERRAVLVCDGSGKELAAVALESEPAGFDALVGEKLFLLNGPGAAGRPVIVLQTSERPSVLFVPADSSTL